MIAVLDTDAALLALAPEWEALWHACERATPFASPHWLLPWWRQFGTGQPRVAVARAGGRLTGVLPLYFLPEERKALPIGAGTTDYLDGLGDLDGLLEAALARLASDGIDACDLIDVPPGSPLVGRCAPGWSASWSEGETCPVLALPGLPPRARRALTMNRNRMSRAGRWCVDIAGADGLEAGLHALERLHRARWESRGEPGVLGDPKVVAFWHGAAPGLHAAGLLRLGTLSLEGEVIAACVTLLSPGRLYFYLSGFDEAHAFSSPGTVLVGGLLEQAAAEGRKEAHFLRGGEAYKYRWGAVDRFNQRCSFVPDPDQRYPAPASASNRSGEPSHTIRACSST